MRHLQVWPCDVGIWGQCGEVQEYWRGVYVCVCVRGGKLLKESRREMVRPDL